LETYLETVSKRMQLLEERHSKLNEECDRLSKVVGLGSAEQQQLKLLKVQKLKCRDAMTALRRENNEIFPDLHPANDPVNW
jgi:uncharacterized protein YdcH (DUF465 family)